LDVTAADEDELTLYRRHHVGFVFQFYNLLPSLTARENVELVTEIFTWRGEHVATVPASAVFRDKEHWAVYTVEDGRARLRRIGLGHRGRLDVELASGLLPGTRVILHPTDRIADGIAIEPR
jgi:predicted ABC-type transport system involved in lysophospholipase L1 biosynthesis ATPase subunit